MVKHLKRTVSLGQDDMKGRWVVQSNEVRPYQFSKEDGFNKEYSLMLAKYPPEGEGGNKGCVPPEDVGVGDSNDSCAAGSASCADGSSVASSPVAVRTPKPSALPVAQQQRRRLASSPSAVQQRTPSSAEPAPALVRGGHMCTVE